MIRVRRALAVVVVVIGRTARGLAGIETPVAHATATAVVVVDTGSFGALVVVDVGGRHQRHRGAAPAAAVETVSYGGVGVAVCRIDGVGNPPDGSCLIGPGGAYWSYWCASGGVPSWSCSGGGAGATTVQGGDVEGWRYGTGAAASVGLVLRPRGQALSPPPPSPPAPAPAPRRHHLLRRRPPFPPPSGAPTVSGGTTPATGSSGADGTKAGAAASAPDRGAAEDGGQDERDGSAARATQGDAPSTSAAFERARRRLDGDAEAALAAPSGDDGDGGLDRGRRLRAGCWSSRGGGGGPRRLRCSVVPARPSALGPRRPSTRSRELDHSITVRRCRRAQVRSEPATASHDASDFYARHAAQGVRRRDRQPVLGGRPLIVGDGDMRDVDETLVGVVVTSPPYLQGLRGGAGRGRDPRDLLEYLRCCATCSPSACECSSPAAGSR